MLNVHQSNRLETLARQLAALTRVPLASALTPEVVVVPSHGVARWLALRLAGEHGVCANVQFPFPAAHAWSLYRALGELPAATLSEREPLAWRIMQLLPDLEATPAFASVQGYVSGDISRRYELSQRLAETFEQYLLYRPDWIAQWESGIAPHWQARLWQRVVQQASGAHRAAVQRRFVDALDASLLARAGIPERICVFGAPALPPALLELYAALGRHIEVHLFLCNPCQEYWGDIAKASEIARSTLACRPEARYLETGNALLASLGKQGRDFLDLLNEHPAREYEAFAEPGAACLLAAVQSDVLHLRDRRAAGGVMEIAPDDRSVQVHVCHSAMREVEVLHDQMLALFERYPDLEPSDVVVMTPDVETYAPYVEAVFATAEPRIPFNVSDRSAERESSLAATFLALLELPGSRYEASSVLELLDEPSVRRRFAINDEDLDLIHAWVRESGIRWGIDGEHRARFDLPSTAEHTWRFGLDRLLLGYALPGGGESLHGGILPYDDVEGSQGAVLGSFATFAEAVIALHDVADSRTVAQWAERLRALLGQFFDATEESEAEIETLRAAIAALESDAAAGGFGGAVPLDIVKRALRSRLEAPARAFLSGGVTFCAMVPMRSLPFEVVCLIGMNDGAFPRMRRPYGFDLMATDFRKGDRSRREDDRYLFLESLLSARRCFYVSYTGQHVRDNSVIPPSVLVSELLDYFGQNFLGPGQGDLRAHLVTHHPLQPFNPRYFDKQSGLFSYSVAWCRAASLAGYGESGPAPFLEAPFAQPGEEWRTVELPTLIRFLRNPARYFLRERLGIHLEEAEEELDGREPLISNALELYAMKQRLLALRLRGEPLTRALAAARGSALLPHAQVGAIVFEETAETVERFARTLAHALPATPLEPVGFDLALDSMRIHGVLTGLGADGLFGYRLAKCQPKDLLDAWIRHLVLNTVAPRGVACRTRWMLEDKLLVFEPMHDAQKILERVAALYWSGVCRPLPLFPRSAKAYVEKGASLDAARQEWTANHHPECVDPYFRLAFRGCDPLDQAFERVATELYAPLLAAMTEARPA